MRNLSFKFCWLMIVIAPAVAHGEGISTRPATTQPVTLQAALAAGQDLWGEQAMRRAEGPTYEFFRDLLPPLRYVNTAFRHYPLVLSTPGALVRSRLISNGSAVNARASLGTWQDVGIPVSFLVGGEEAVPFGEDLGRLIGPRYRDGYLPVVQMRYRTDGLDFEQEAFAPTEERLNRFGSLLVRFQVPKGGRVLASLEGKMTPQGRLLLDAKGSAVVAYSPEWKWHDGTLVTQLEEKGGSAVLLIFTQPCPPDELAGTTLEQVSRQREQCVQFWHDRLSQGARFEVPEPVVNDAWRAQAIGISMLIKGKELCYSAGNAYEREYECESGDAVRALVLYGHAEQARDLLGPLMDYRQKGLAFHDAGFKLQLLAHYYWITRDREAISTLRPKWAAEVARIIDGRQKESGLFPPENYCGDIHTQVVTLTSNSTCWRGLRDIAAVLGDMNEPAEAGRIAAIAGEFRTAIHKGTEQSIRRDFDPPFVPVALFGKEQPYEAITGSMLGSYWNLVVPYVLDSRVFGSDSLQEQWILDTMHRRGGICMGMIRFDQHSGLFANEKGVDDLYGLRYVLTLLRRDEVDRALVSFYGKLAHGLTRDTFIGAEGTGLVPLDAHGRPMYLPPNSSSNALFLWTLRYLLVQDWDIDDDGTPDTLRLLYATPRQWLEDGNKIVVERAPTAFGPVSVTVESQLSQSQIRVHVDLPPRRPGKTLLRLRPPAGWAVRLADGITLQGEKRMDGVLDLTSRTGSVDLSIAVQRAP